MGLEKERTFPTHFRVRGKKPQRSYCRWEQGRLGGAGPRRCAGRGPPVPLPLGQLERGQRPRCCRRCRCRDVLLMVFYSRRDGRAEYRTFQPAPEPRLNIPGPRRAAGTTQIHPGGGERIARKAGGVEEEA